MNSDTDWLADEEGNLRPAVARALQETEGERATPSATPSAGRNPGSVTDALTLIAILALALGGIAIYEFHEAALRQFHSRIVAEQVPLRAAPSDSARVFRILTIGDRARIETARDGWYQICNPDGCEGWIWGGFLGKDTGPWHGPGIVVDSVIVDNATTHRTIVPGERVVIEKQGHSRSTLILIDGTRTEAPSKAILALE